MNNTDLNIRHKKQIISRIYSQNFSHYILVVLINRSFLPLGPSIWMSLYSTSPSATLPVLWYRPSFRRAILASLCHAIGFRCSGHTAVPSTAPDNSTCLFGDQQRVRYYTRTSVLQLELCFTHFKLYISK